MKRATLIALIALVVTAFAATTASAKPVKPGPPGQDRVEPARASSDPVWPGIAMAGGIVALAVAGIARPGAQRASHVHVPRLEHSTSSPSTGRF